MSLRPIEAIYLPAAVEVTAKVGGFSTVNALVAIAKIPELWDYLAETCRKLARQPQTCPVCSGSFEPWMHNGKPSETCSMCESERGCP